MKQKSRFCTARRILIFWTLFIGLGAMAGALAMLLDPSGKSMGMDAMLPYFQVLPFADVVFQDFTFSGWALLIVNGLTNLTAAGKIKEADYILVHHQNSVYENAAEEMDELLGITHTALRSVRCREGTYKCIKGEKR